MLGENEGLHKSAVVLAGGESSRFGKDKGIVNLLGKPLINWVINSIRPMVNEIVIVTCCHEKIVDYSEVVGSDVKFAIDKTDSKGPLIGALSGFSTATGEYVLLLPADTPFVSRKVVALLFDLAKGRSAAIPRWPNGQIEPLHAVYQTKEALDAADAAIKEGRLDMRSMIERMQGLRFVSTLVIEQLDPKLETFFNINTPFDLRRAGELLKKKLR